MKIQYLAFDLDLEVKGTREVVLYHLHHVTCTHARFEAAIFNGFGRRRIYKKIIICALTLTLGLRSLKM